MNLYSFTWQGQTDSGLYVSTFRLPLPSDKPYFFALRKMRVLMFNTTFVEQDHLTQLQSNPVVPVSRQIQDVSDSDGVTSRVGLELSCGRYQDWQGFVGVYPNTNYTIVSTHQGIGVNTLYVTLNVQYIEIPTWKVSPK